MSNRDTARSLPPTQAQHNRQVDQRLQAHDRALEAGELRMEGIEQKLAAVLLRQEQQAQELAKNTEVTTEVRDILSAVRQGLKVVGGIGSAAKWMGTLATAGLAIWGVIYSITHGGQLPPKH